MNRGRSLALVKVAIMSPQQMNLCSLAGFPSYSEIQCRIQNDQDDLMRYSMTQSDSPFIRIRRDDMLIFALNLEFLSSCEHWFVDGTFRVCVIILWNKVTIKTMNIIFISSKKMVTTLYGSNLAVLYLNYVGLWTKVVFHILQKK